MQPNFPQNNRQRPLQKSMFLPQPQQFANQSSPINYQYQDMMKRSSINPDTNKFNSFQYNPNIHPQTPIHQFNHNNTATLNFAASNRFKQGPRVSQLEQMPQSQVNPQLAIQELQEKINQLTQMVQTHDDILKKHNISAQKDKKILQSQAEQIEAKIKQNVLPTMISRQTKEIYEHIFNFKLQIKTLKDQVTEINDKFKNQLLTLVNGGSKSASTVNSVERIQRNQEPIAQLTANVYSLENKLLDVQKALQNKNDDLKVFIMAQIQKSKAIVNFNNKSPTKPRSSTIQSTLSPIMLEYRQIFAVKTSISQSPQKLRMGVSSPRSRDQRQIIINSSTYFIDREGYLLDSQNRYIIDAKGLQIKLEQKHLALLKEHNVLN